MTPDAPRTAPRPRRPEARAPRLASPDQNPPPRRHKSSLLKVPGAVLMATGCTFLAFAGLVVQMRPGFGFDNFGFFTLAVVFGLSIWIAGRIPALASLAIGCVSWLIVFSLPGFTRTGHGGGNEANAIGALRSINSSQQAYASACGNGGYASLLEDLQRPPREGGPPFIAPDLSHSGVVRSGYIINLRPAPGARVVTPAAKTCNAATADTVSAYFAEAHPAEFGTTGTRSFATDEQGVIYETRQNTVLQPQDLASATPVQ